MYYTLLEYIERLNSNDYTSSIYYCITFIILIIFSIVFVAKLYPEISKRFLSKFLYNDNKEISVVSILLNLLMFFGFTIMFGLD